MRSLITAIAALVLLGCGADTKTRLTANDVSVLFPPASAQALWPASTPARGGPLLPRSEFERMALSLVREVDEDAEYDALRVVAIRFDPCFQVELGGTCHPQIRLVFQIPDPAEDRSGAFLDGAIHALYALTPTDFDKVLDELRELAALAPENAAQPALGVSPVLAAQGLDGPYATRLKALVTTHAGQGALVRMTFMTRTFARSGQWQFGGFITGHGKLPIASVTGTQQNVTRNLADAIEYTVVPMFGELVGRPGASAHRMGTLDPAGRADVHAWALRQQDPARHLPDTTDCASCHLSGHVANHLEALEPALATAARPSRAARALSAVEDDPDNLRAFGWIGPHPHVAQRTANETAAVLRALASP